MDFIGRIARFRDAYVSITGFDEETQACEILPLLAPNEPVTSNSKTSMPLESLVFYPEESFAAQFPSAVNYNADMTAQTDSGVVYNLSAVDLPPQLLDERGKWVITHSCRVTGARTVPDFNGQVNPTTVIRNEVHISNDDGAGIVEFEDIFFELAGTYRTALKHNSGRHVVFRRCRFSASMHGVDFSQPAGQEDAGFAVSVTFERCTFHRCKHGLHSNGNVNILMLNCFASDCTTGVFSGNSHVTAKHCGFHRNEYGAHSIGEESFVDLTKCTFINNKYGVDNSGRATCIMQGCRIGSTSSGSCLQGIQLSGRNCSTMHIDKCVIYKCDTGVMIERGHVDFTMLNSKILTQNTHIVGVEVRFDAIGNVDFVDCEISNFEIWSGKKCFVTIDGKAITPKPMGAIKQRIEECLDDPNLHQRRLLKRAGVGAVTCTGCGKAEPEGVRFKRCQPCYNTVYCSKECQVSFCV